MSKTIKADWSISDHINKTYSLNGTDYSIISVRSNIVYAKYLNLNSTNPRVSLSLFDDKTSITSNCNEESGLELLYLWQKIPLLEDQK